MEQDDKKGSGDVVLVPAHTTTEARREFIARLGRYALYTAPLFLEMNIPTASAADESAPPPPD